MTVALIMICLACSVLAASVVLLALATMEYRHLLRLALAPPPRRLDQRTVTIPAHRLRYMKTDKILEELNG